MNLVKQFWYRPLQGLTSLTWTALPLLLIGCANVAPQETITTDNLSVTDDVNFSHDIDEEIIETLPLSAEVVYYVLAAEIAGQRGEIGLATDLYYEAAESVDSPVLANRATRVATYSRDQARITRALGRWQAVAPDDADVILMRMPFLIGLGEYDKAVAMMNKAIALEPEKKNIYLASFAEQLSQQAASPDALPTLQKLDIYIADDVDARFAYARLAAFYREYNLALAEVEKLLADAPKESAFLVLKAEILQRKGETEQALRLIEKPAQHQNAPAELRYTYGKLLGEAGQTDKAQAVFQRLNAEDPTNNEVIFALGLLALEREDGASAREYFTELVKNGDPGLQAGYFLGLAEELNDNFDTALMWFASVPVESPRFESAQGRYIAILSEQGDLSTAREHLKLLRQQRPDRAVDFYLYEVSFLREHGLKADAMKVFNEALQRYPDNFELLYGRALLAESLDELTVTEADLRKILAIDPNNSAALNALGYTLTDRTDRHDEALVYIERALTLKPNDPYYLDSLGWVHYRLSNLEKAEHYLRLAYDIQPDAEFGAHLGEVLWQRGKTEEAKQIWREALERDEKNKVLQETLRRLSQ